VRRLVVGMVIAFALLAVGCSQQPALPVDASPEVVAQRYFELLAKGDKDAARALMWHPERFDETVPETGYKGLTDLLVGVSQEGSAAYRPDEYRVFGEIRLLRVEYVRHRTDSVGTPPGGDGRFVLLGRETESDPWRVIEIGTGP
jgi:hypothetical protein